MTTIELLRGDITSVAVDAIVNAANSSLLGGGGVDGAIHAAGGPAVLAACRELRRTVLPDGLPTGAAVATPAGRLPATWVIHTVGPKHWEQDEATGRALLASCYRESLRIAGELGAGSIAFPAISAGVYRWPLDEAAEVAIGAVLAAGTATPSVRSVRFVLFGDDAMAAFERALADR